MSANLIMEAAAGSAPDFGIQDPRVLGPLAAFVFVIFVMEVIVPGKSYKREMDESKRLRALVEKVIPLSEEMVEVSRSTLEMLGALTTAMEANSRILESATRTFEEQAKERDDRTRILLDIQRMIERGDHR